MTEPAAADPTAYQKDLTSIFQDHGFSSCDGNGLRFEYGTEMILAANATSSLLPTDTVITLTSTTSPSPASNNSSQSPTISPAAENLSSGFTTRDKAAIGVVIPVVAIISFALGMIFYLRRHRKRKRSQSGRRTNETEENQPYLQQKGELEAEEKRRLELEAVEVRYEMDGGDNSKEMPAPGSNSRNEIDTMTRPPVPSLRERQELKGEDCSNEPDASSRPDNQTSDVSSSRNA